MKAKNVEFNISVTISWECSNCNHKNKLQYRGNPYTAEAENEPEEFCEKYKELNEISFYEED